MTGSPLDNICEWCKLKELVKDKDDGMQKCHAVAAHMRASTYYHGHNMGGPNWAGPVNSCCTLFGTARFREQSVGLVAQDGVKAGPDSGFEAYKLESKEELEHLQEFIPPSWDLRELDL